MNKEVSVIKRINSQLSFLKNLEQVEESVQLNKRSEKTHYPDGYSGQPVTRKAINDDFILLLPIKNKPEVLGITLNYLNRSLESAELIIGTSFRNNNVRTLTLSNSIIGVDNIKKSLNNFVSYLSNNPTEDLISAAENIFDIELTSENKDSRDFVRKQHTTKVERVNELLKKTILIMTESEEAFKEIPQLLSETDEAKNVARLKRELVEAEKQLHLKKQTLLKPIEVKNNQKENIAREMNALKQSIEQKSTETIIGENANQQNKKKFKI